MYSRVPQYMGAKIRGTLFGSPYNRDPITSGTILGSPIFGNPHLGAVAKQTGLPGKRLSETLSLNRYPEPPKPLN